MNKIDVLPPGYVRLVDHMGDDLTVVNAARVSFNKESDWDCLRWEDPITGDPEGRVRVITTRQLKPKDRRLLHYLAEHGHTSPFRHCVLSFEVYAPMMVMRQWGKYRVGSAWSFEDSDDPLETINESSRRYVTEEPEFYLPNTCFGPEWRSAPENKKQGSGEPIDPMLGLVFDSDMYQHTQRSLELYRSALTEGICAEQARLFLPAYALMLRARWTVSLQGVIHFLQQRLHDDAQEEIRVYAKAVYTLAQPLYPESCAAFLKD